MQDLSNGLSRTNGRWTKEQHLKFLEGLRVYGKNWKKIEQLVSTRTGTQIRSHAQKFFLKGRQSPLPEQPLSPLCCDEEQEEATLNSKTSADSPLHGEESYFLTRIIEFSNGRQCLDFWNALVDCRDATASLNRSIGNNSFRVYGTARDRQNDRKEGESVGV